jgi:hypothetical protein
MVRLEPGVYVVNRTISMADLCGERIIRPAQGTLDKQLNRGAECGPESSSRDTLGQDGGTTAT